MTMPKKLSRMTLLMLLPFASLAATQPNTKSKSAVPHTVETKTFDTGNGCVVRLADPFHGHVYGSAGESDVIPDMGGYWTDKPPIKTDVDADVGFRLDFECIDITPQTMHEVVEEEYRGHYDPEKKNWVPYYGSEEGRRLLADVTHLYPLKTANANGFALTHDQITGDYERRTRFLSYCLLHGKKALCGQTQVMVLGDPGGNLLPYAMKILRSIEFIDPPSSSSGATPTTPPPPTTSSAQ